jgi:valyl-tRNA synthetase
MLNNEKFVANAPQEVLTTNKENLANSQEKLLKIDTQLKELRT